MSYVKRLKKLGERLCPEDSVIRGRTIRGVIRSINKTCDGFGLRGTAWEFKENDITQPFTELPKKFFVNFFVDGDVDTLLMFKEHGGSQYVCFQTGNGEDGYSPAFRYEYNNWQNYAFRKVVFLDGDDIDNPELIAWVQANAVQMK